MKTSPMIVVMALLVGAFGASMYGSLGGLTGLAVGALIGMQILTQDRLRVLERHVKQLRQQLAEAAAPAPRAESVPQAPAAAPLAMPSVQATPAAATVPAATRIPAAAPGGIERAFAWIKNYMSTGNVVAKVGVLVLFVGVSFLLKYAVDRNALPIEIRLVATGLGAIALIGIGWRMRATRNAFGLILQGAGIGILYVTVFAAARLYQVLPLAMALPILLALVALGALLAVLQDARALATLGTIGGFLAPVLTSTGSGNHVALFSYYALLNLGIVGIAWFKAWRILNVVGFAFTFVIGALWGFKYYQPQYFASTEPFLILSFVFYLAVSMLFAHRHPPRLRGYVDGTLVFGLPLVCFSLQAPMVRDMEFGRALTALGMGLIYLAVGRWLWGRRIEHMRLLIESQLAIGVVALSLAIPFAFDGHITAAGWALEGAGLIWIGIRQQRPLARAFGVLLQIGAGAAFFVVRSHGGAEELPLLNTHYLGSVLVALGSLYSSYLLFRARDDLGSREALARLVLMSWGLAWWFGAGLHEIGLHVEPQFETTSILLFAALSTAALAQLAWLRTWRPATQITQFWLPVLTLIACGRFLEESSSGPIGDLRYLGWLTGIGAGLFALRRGEGVAASELLRAGHRIAWWLLVFLASWAGSWWIGQTLGNGASWAFAAWGVIPAASLWLMLRFGERLAWPVRSYRDIYLLHAQLPMAIAILLWVLYACTQRGDPAPLPYVPVLNPLDLAQAACLLILARWWFAARADADLNLPRMHPALPYILLGGTTFVWLNAATARAVHFLGGVYYAPHALRHSAVFQGSISVLWAVTALLLMLSASKTDRRKLWLCGAGLLGLLVLKLFFVDLAGSSTVARIVSFMGAGALMLLIGYLSPAPPRESTETAT